jgi:hypothetical protein
MLPPAVRPRFSEDILNITLGRPLRSALPSRDWIDKCRLRPHLQPFRGVTFRMQP